MAIKWHKGNEMTGWGADAKPRPTYDGAVISMTGRDVRVMSDVWEWITYARVWDGEKVIETAVKSGDYICGEAVIDATPEVLAKVAAYEAAAAIKAAELAEAARKARALDEAARVTKGKDVTVVRGRKVPKGTTGRVIWIGEGKWGWRVGVKDANGEAHWTALSNVEVTDPAKYLAA